MARATAAPTVALVIALGVFVAVLSATAGYSFSCSIGQWQPQQPTQASPSLRDGQWQQQQTVSSPSFGVAPDGVPAKGLGLSAAKGAGLAVVLSAIVLFFNKKNKLRYRYHFYCNKMYTVIRDSSSSTLDMTPSSEETLSNLDPQKAVVRNLNDAAQFVKPAMWNRPLFRATALVLGGAAAGHVMPFAPMLHLSAYGVWLGTNVWTTFIAGITMFKNLPRQQFGSLQAKLFPKYFQLGTVCTTMLMLTGVRLGIPVGPAAVSLLGTLANLLYLEPKATAVMFERYEREKQGLKDATVDKELKGKFGKLHGMSSLANLVALVALVTHGALLAARI